MDEVVIESSGDPSAPVVVYDSNGSFYSGDYNSDSCESSYASASLVSTVSSTGTELTMEEEEYLMLNSVIDRLCSFVDTVPTCDAEKNLEPNDVKPSLLYRSKTVKNPYKLRGDSYLSKFAAANRVKSALEHKEQKAAEAAAAALEDETGKEDGVLEKSYLKVNDGRSKNTAMKRFKSMVQRKPSTGRAHKRRGETGNAATGAGQDPNHVHSHGGRTKPGQKRHRKKKKKSDESKPVTRLSDRAPPLQIVLESPRGSDVGDCETPVVKGSKRFYPVTPLDNKEEHVKNFFGDSPPTSPTATAMSTTSTAQTLKAGAPMTSNKLIMSRGPPMSPSAKVSPSATMSPTSPMSPKKVPPMSPRSNALLIPSPPMSPAVSPATSPRFSSSPKTVSRSRSISPTKQSMSFFFSSARRNSSSSITSPKSSSVTEADPTFQPPSKKEQAKMSSGSSTESLTSIVKSPGRSPINSSGTYPQSTSTASSSPSPGMPTENTATDETLPSPLNSRSPRGKRSRRDATKLRPKRIDGTESVDMSSTKGQKGVKPGSVSTKTTTNTSATAATSPTTSPNKMDHTLSITHPATRSRSDTLKRIISTLPLPPGENMNEITSSSNASNLEQLRASPKQSSPKSFSSSSSSPTSISPVRPRRTTLPGKKERVRRIRSTLPSPPPKECTNE